MRYALGIDQSTQGTKLLLFDENGAVAAKEERPHRQIINEKGWVSHDMNEVYRNILDSVRAILEKAGLTGEEIACVGISNQRETTVAWGEDGIPLADAIVWQCGRASEIAKSHSDEEEYIRSTSGLQLSAFYPAAKMQWLLENETSVAAAAGKDLHFGTVDSYLIYRLTGAGSFCTDATNAARTQLLDLKAVRWDEKLCGIFGIPMSALPKIKDSNADFGETDFEGILPKKVKIHAALGDSHASLFGQGCHRPGMVKATYGTGSSVVMNTGDRVYSDPALASCIAYQTDGKTVYCLEGNINYTGAVITWLKDDAKLISSVSEVEPLIAQANPEDEAIVIPAFTGLSAPHWNESARAAILFMSRTTGRAELVKAATESIAHQVSDVLECMSRVTGTPVSALRVDGGPSRNAYLMQFQSDCAGCELAVPERAELSAAGAAFMAGMAVGLYDEGIIGSMKRLAEYRPEMEEDRRKKIRGHWKQGIRTICRATEETLRELSVSLNNVPQASGTGLASRASQPRHSEETGV